MIVSQTCSSALWQVRSSDRLKLPMKVKLFWVFLMASPKASACVAASGSPRIKKLRGVSVGTLLLTPVGPINETGSPFLKVAHKRALAPCSKTERVMVPFSGSACVAASARLSVCSKVFPTFKARVAKFCRRKNCPGLKRFADKGALMISSSVFLFFRSIDSMLV